MAIAIKDILRLSIFGTIIQSEGTSGLNREVKRVSVIDCAIDETDLLKSHIINEGDFFISNLFAVKENKDDLINLVYILNKYKSSGLCIVNQYFEELPAEIIDFATKNSFFIMLINQDVSYADIIRDVMELILQEKNDTILEIKIDCLLKMDSSINEIIQIANDINKNFFSNIVVLHLKKYVDLTEANYLIKEIDNLKTSVSSAVKYKQGLLIFSSFNESTLKHLESQIDYIVNLINSFPTEHCIGVSRIHKGIENLKKCITEAITSGSIADVLNSNVLNYRDIGLYKLLVPLINKPELKEFCDDMLNEIKIYDDKHKTVFLSTVTAYIQYDGDFKKVAEIMFQHENTIRHRIAKIQKMLGFENRHMEFYTYFYIAVKSNDLINRINK